MFLISGDTEENRNLAAILSYHRRNLLRQVLWRCLLVLEQNSSPPAAAKKKKGEKKTNGDHQSQRVAKCS